LPKDVSTNDVVSYAKTTKGNVTVENKPIQLKAQCRNGKLVDRKRREIRFFHPSCWGNPPPDYLEIQQRENAELKKLKASYTVIVFGCSPMISSVTTPRRPAPPPRLSLSSATLVCDTRVVESAPWRRYTQLGLIYAPAH
jgi:hypothetical protein